MMTMKNNKFIARAEKLQIIRIGILCFTIFLSLAGLACQSSENIGADSVPGPTPEKQRDYFQEALSSIQAGGFDFVFAFRRLDGATLDADDKKYLKQNAPLDTNRWNLTDDGKIAIAGSNYKFTPENLEALSKRFAIEDYSRAKNENNEDNNSNAGK
jgi:hypothetical protein